MYKSISPWDHDHNDSYGGYHKKPAWLIMANAHTIGNGCTNMYNQSRLYSHKRVVSVGFGSRPVSAKRAAQVYEESYSEDNTLPMKNNSANIGTYTSSRNKMVLGKRNIVVYRKKPLELKHIVQKRRKVEDCKKVFGGKVINGKCPGSVSSRTYTCLKMKSSTQQTRKQKTLTLLKESTTQLNEAMKDLLTKFRDKHNQYPQSPLKSSIRSVSGKLDHKKYYLGRLSTANSCRLPKNNPNPNPNSSFEHIPLYICFPTNIK